MGPLLALASAICYGIVVPHLSASLEAGGAPIAGGILSRRASCTAVTFLGQLGGLVLAGVAALLVSASSVHLTDLLWGALSGAGSCTAMRFLNRGLSRGAMSLVVPISAVTGVALSVVCGVLALGDRPGALAWAGIVVTVSALWLVAGGGAGGPWAREVRCGTVWSPAPASPSSTSRSASRHRPPGCGR